MKKFAMAAVGAAALTFASSAQAAPVIKYTPGLDNAFSAIFSSVPGKGTFDDVFVPFTTAVSGYLSGTISTANAKFKFTSAYVKAGTSNLISFSPAPAPGGVSGGFDPVLLKPGTYYVEVVGKSPTKDAGYSGTLNFDGVPEPGAWALMIVGFGAVGFAMRRQRATFHVAYS